MIPVQVGFLILGGLGMGPLVQIPLLGEYAIIIMMVVIAHTHLPLRLPSAAYPFPRAR